jgi:hypothetical protein
MSISFRAMALPPEVSIDQFGGLVDATQFLAPSTS